MAMYVKSVQNPDCVDFVPKIKVIKGIFSVVSFYRLRVLSNIIYVSLTSSSLKIIFILKYQIFIFILIQSKK